VGLLAALIAPGILASGMFMADVTGYPERAAGMARAGDPAQSPMARSAPMGMLSLLPPSPPTQVPPRPGRPAAGDAGDTAHQGGGMAGTGQGVRTGAPRPRATPPSRPRPPGRPPPGTAPCPGAAAGRHRRKKHATVC